MSRPAHAEQPFEIPGGKGQTIALPGFEMRELLRSTAVGYWLRAHQLRIDRDVIVKVAPRGNGRAAMELDREVRLLGSLRDRSVIALIDYHGEGDAPCAVFESPDGVSLDEALRAAGGVLEPRMAARIAAGLIDAVLLLHGRGKCLRRLEPADLAVGAGGRVTVTSLEGIWAGERKDSLWLVDDGGEPQGDALLVGLHLFYMLTGKVPVPASITESPQRWLDMARRGLERGVEARLADAPVDDAAPESQSAALRARVEAQAILGVLAALFHALERPPALREVRAELELIAAGRVEKRRAAAGVRALRPALLVVALLFGIGIGAVGWRQLLSPPGRGEPTAGTPSDRGAPAGAGDAMQAHDAPGASAAASASPAREGRGGDDRTTSPDGAVAIVSDSSPAAPPGARGADVTTDAPPGVTSDAGARRPPQASAGGPIPLITDPGAPTPIEAFVVRAAFELGRDGSVEHFEKRYEEGLRLARRQPVSASPDVERRSAAGPGAASGALFETLLELGARVEAAAIRRDLFHGVIERFEGDEFVVRYDFRSRQELADWVGAREGSAVSISRERLVLLGRVAFWPGRLVRDRVRIEIVVPADGRDPTRANVNVLVDLGQGGEALFGLGTDTGAGLVGEGESRVLLPATVVLHRAVGAGSAWRPLWAATSRTSDGKPLEAMFSWTAGTIEWRAGGRDVVGAAYLSDALGKVSAANALRGVAFETFGSTLEIATVRVSGRLDAERLAQAARDAALERLGRDLSR